MAPLAAPDLDTAFEAMREHGLRVSAARRLVLEELFRTDVPLTAEQIASGRSDLATTYRNLEALERIGLVRHFHLGHGPALYERTGSEVREYLLCDACGSVAAVPPEVLEGVRELIRSTLGHEARFTHFPIAGLCARCANRAEG